MEQLREQKATPLGRPGLLRAYLPKLQCTSPELKVDRLLLILARLSAVQQRGLTLCLLCLKLPNSSREEMKTGRAVQLVGPHI